MTTPLRASSVKRDVRSLQAERRPATATEQAVLAP